MKNSHRIIFFSIFGVLAIIFALFVAYQKLPLTFFQQDEWQYFGLNIYSQLGNNTLATLLLPQEGAVTHFFPLATLFFYVQYIFFGINFPPYIYINLIIHSTNVVLLYILAKQITGNSLSAYLAAVLFSLYSIAHQSVTWVAAGIGTLPSTFFLLLSLITFRAYLLKPTRHALYISLLLALVSLLFKEVSLFLFGFFPLMWFFSEKRKKVPLRRVAIASGLVFFVYAGLRLLFFIGAFRSDMPEIGDISATSPVTYLFRLGTLPFKAISQSLIPVSFLLPLGDMLVRLAYPHFIGSDGAVNPYMSQSIVFDLITYLLSFGILFVVFIVFRILIKHNKKQLARSLVLSISFIVLSALPFIFIPGIGGYFSIFEPRNLYVISIGSTMFLAILFTSPFVYSKKPFVHLFSIALFIGVVVFHVTAIRSHVSSLMRIGSIRKGLLDSILAQNPKLPPRVIFFTDSNQSYYGLPSEQKTLPVQSGFGRMLMVWYQDKEGFPGCLYEEQFLHDLIAEGYRFCGGRGFGYARKYETLLRILKDSELNSSSVIGYSWNGKTEEFRDITGQLRKTVDNDLNKL